MTPRSVTIRDVAREAGVSTSTVSRVINGASGVRADKVRRVRDAVRRLSYQPNPVARDLPRRAAVHTVGVLVPQLADEFTGAVVTGIEQTLRENGLHMLCSLSHADPKDEEVAVGIFFERRVSGLILVTPALHDTSLLEFRDRRVPLVLVNRRLPELAAHCIHVDNREGSSLATRHLLELGHRDIVHIAGPLQRQDARERLEGFFSALTTAGIERDEARVLESDYTAEGGERAMLHLLERRNATAVVAANDLIAAGALVALRRKGLHVPRDVSIVGFDDRSVARLLSPALTTVRYPMHEVGRRAADHLVETISGASPSPLPLLVPELVQRASTAPPVHSPEAG